MKKIKILFSTPFYDSAMDHRLKKIIKDFPLDGFFFKILHFNSVSNPGAVIKPEIEFAEIVDFKDYDTLDIAEILKSERPDVVITITFLHIIDRMIISLCRKLSIPVIIVQHGNITLEVKKSPKKIRTVLFQGIRKYSSFISLYIVSLFRYYSFERFLFLLRLLFNPVKSIQHYTYFSDYSHCYILVFGKYYINFLSELGFNESKILCAGTPSTPGSYSSRKELKDSILYLSGGMAVDKLYGWDIKKERELLIILNDYCSLNSFPLVYRPHPLQSENDTEYICNNMNLFVSRNESLSGILENSKIIIGDCSNALHEAVFNYKPIIIFKENNLVKYRFDYTDYGIGRQADFDNLAPVLDSFVELSEKEKSDYKKFIDDFITDYNKKYSLDVWNIINKIIPDEIHT